MPPPSEPSPHELMRMLEAISREMRDVVQRLDRVVRDAGETYVRKDVYDARHKALREDVEELKQQRQGDTAFRRQMWLALAIAAIGNMIAIALAVTGYITR